jgi:RNA polymerase sigma factor (sigma-70 family)
MYEQQDWLEDEEEEIELAPPAPRLASNPPYSHPAGARPATGTIEELVAAAKAGNDAAMQALWDQFQPLVTRLVARHGRALAEDLPGVAFIFFHQYVLQYDKSRSVPFAGYISEMLGGGVHSEARRGWIEAGRNAKEGCDDDDCGCLQGAGRVADPAQMPKSDAENDDIAQRVVRQQTLDRLLAQLSPRERFVVILHARDGYTHAEIAAKLGISEGGVKVIYCRAKQKLRQRCAENPDEAL